MAIIISINMRAMALFTSADPRLSIMAIGRVSVFMKVAPASIIVAPNSPTALAQVRIAAEISPFLAKGSVTLMNALNLLQPSVLETSS